MIIIHGHKTYLMLQLFNALLELAPGLGSICEIEVCIANLGVEKLVLLSQAGLDTFAVDQKVLGDGQ